MIFKYSSSEFKSFRDKIFKILREEVSKGTVDEKRKEFVNIIYNLCLDGHIHNLKKLDVVNIMSNYKGKERKVFNFLVVPYNIPKGDLAAYYPETNPLIPIDEFADKSNTPISKSVRVTLEKV